MPEHGTLEGGLARLRAAAERWAAAVADGAGTWYTLRQRTTSCPADYVIQNGRGEGIMHVTCAPPRPQDTLVFLDADGRELYRTAAPASASPARMDIVRPDGTVAAAVHNALLSPVRDRWRIDVPGAEGMVAAGSVLQHEFVLRRGGDTVAVASKTRVPRRDTYGVRLDDAADPPLALAVVVVLDLLAHRVSARRPGEPAPGDP